MRSILKWFAAGAVFVALTALAARVARVYPVSSDDATGLLEARSVLGGNVLLKGWTLSNISFYATDLPFYVAGVALRGPRPSLMRDVPVVLYAITVAAAAFLARGETRGARRLAAVGTVAVLLGLPAGGLAEFVTKGYVRVGTSSGLFVALLALDAPPGRRVGIVRLVAFAVVMALTILSDSYTLAVGAGAVLAACLWGAIRKGLYEGVPFGRVAVAVGGSVVMALILSGLIRAAGGHRETPAPLRQWVPYPDPVGVVAGNARALAGSLATLYRCDDSGPSVVRLIGLIGPALVALALVPGRRRKGDFVADVLAASMVVGASAFFVSGMPKDKETTRYMIPFVLSGAVLAGRVLAGRLVDLRPLAVALGVLGLGHGASVAADLRKAPATDPAVALASWLEGRGLRHGYGPYWDSSIVTATSEGRVSVRAVRGRKVSPVDLVIEPFRWMTDARWYDEGPVTFVVYKTDPGKKFTFLINESNCARCFGPPAQRHEAGPYTVLVWGHDLRPLLTQGLPWTP